MPHLPNERTVHIYAEDLEFLHSVKTLTKAPRLSDAFSFLVESYKATHRRPL